MTWQSVLWKTALALTAICVAHPVHALDPNRTIAQYLREQWSADQGFTGRSVTALAQTKDGYLWIGTDKGLLRFDGSSFRAFSQATPTTFQIGPVQALLTDAEGTLWVVLQSTQIVRYNHGRFEPGHDEAEFGITSIAARSDGTVLLSSLSLGTLRYRANKYLTANSSVLPQSQEGADNLSSRLSSFTGAESHSFAEPASAVISMAESADGREWLGTRDKGLFYAMEGKVTASGVKLPSAKVNCLLMQKDGELWIGTANGMLRLAGNKSASVPSPLQHLAIFAMILDRDGNVWVGTAGGLFRMNANGIAMDLGNPAGPVTALVQDADGNLWFGSPQGISCLRDSTFITYAVAGLNAESAGAIYADPSSRVWYAPIEGGLRWMKGKETGQVTSDLLSKDVIYSITGNKDEVWVGRQQGGLTRLVDRGGSVAARTYTEADGLAQNSVYTVHEESDGTVWAGTVSAGLSRLKDGNFSTYTVADGLGSNRVTAIADGPSGEMWFGTSAGLSQLDDGKWRTFTSHDGLPANNVNSLLHGPDGIVWIGTAGGLAYLRAGHIYSVPALQESVLGLADDQLGWLWVTTSHRVLRLKRDALLEGRLLDTDMREYGVADGLHGTEGVKRDRSVVKDQQGNVWLSLNTGLSVVHPSRASQETSPPRVHVDAIYVDGNSIAVQQPLRIPASQRRIVIDYSAVSLVASDRVRFRYQLDGFDHGWSEPVTARQAVYTNLGPGAYTFRIAASNSYGAWNGSEAALPLHIAPALWQTWWFQFSAMLFFVLLTWLIYRLRLHQISRQVEMRVEERANERARIARELHDSLLQGFQGLLLYLQVAQHMLPARPDEAREALEKVLDQGDLALAEARNAVQDLRGAPVAAGDLATSLAAIGRELSAVENAAQFRVMVEGKPQTLDPILRDEVYRFAREALRNAFSHAQAQNIEAEITYGELRFCLRVRDDGVGIDPKVIRQGRRAGHWGLPGMRERAESVGAEMELWSEAAAGTEIQLTIPAKIAYGASFKPGRFQFFGRRKTPTS